MPFYSTRTIPASVPADESELSRHTQPTTVRVPQNAHRYAGMNESGEATGTNSVGNGQISASKAASKGVQEISSAISDASSKVQSGIAQAQSAAADPVSFVAGLAQQATGFSVPTSPEGLVALLSKFSKPKVTGDGTTDISKRKSEGENVIEEIGDVASVVAQGPGALASKISSVSSALAPVTEAAGAVTELASLGGVPVDNVISQSISKVTQPVQSSLTKVTNVTDQTRGIIT